MSEFLLDSTSLFATSGKKYTFWDWPRNIIKVTENFFNKLFKSTKKESGNGVILLRKVGNRCYFSKKRQ